MGVPKIRVVAPGQTNMLEVKEALSQHIRAEHTHLGDIAEQGYDPFPDINYVVVFGVKAPVLSNAAWEKIRFDVIGQSTKTWERRL